MNPFNTIAPAAKDFVENHRHWIYLVLAAILLAGGGFAVGRYLTPPATITTEKVHEVTKDVVVTKTEIQIQKVYIHDSEKQEKIHRVVAETTATDGSKTKTTTEDIGVDTVVHDNTHDTEVKYVDRVVEKYVDRIVEKKTQVLKTNDWRIAAGAGIAIPYFLGQGSPGIPGLQGAVINVEADRRIIGPFWMGLQGNSQGVVGLNLSAVF